MKKKNAAKKKSPGRPKRKEVDPNFTPTQKAAAESLGISPGTKFGERELHLAL